MKILQKLKDGANRATEKAQHVVEVNKLNSQISEIEQQKNSYYLQMGKVFYEGYRQQDMTIAEKEMVELAQTCDGLQEQIEAIRNRIAVLKNERVCECGRVVALDANFCPYCGNKLANLIDPEESAPEESREPERKSMFDKREYAAAEEIQEEQDDVQTYDYRPNPDPYEPDLYDPEPERQREEIIERSSEPEVDPERLRLEQEEQERERRHWEELERERERQLELDRRIRFWQENNQSQDYVGDDEATRDMVKCQICSVDLPKGSKWCPRCGAEQI
ncbi:zinc ribbon domain-containing protein [Paenibacillus lautus]